MKDTCGTFRPTNSGWPHTFDHLDLPLSPDRSLCSIRSRSTHQILEIRMYFLFSRLKYTLRQRTAYFTQVCTSHSTSPHLSSTLHALLRLHPCGLLKFSTDNKTLSDTTSLWQHFPHHPHTATAHPTITTPNIPHHYFGPQIHTQLFIRPTDPRSYFDSNVSFDNAQHNLHIDTQKYTSYSMYLPRVYSTPRLLEVLTYYVGDLSPSFV